MQKFVKHKIETHQQLFDEMMNYFNISAKELAEAAGISEVMLSKFRRGKSDLGMSKFLSVFAVIPDEAKEWYVSRLLGIKPKASLRSQIIAASPQEKAEVFNALAIWVVESSECKDSSCLPQTV
ncbi:MAG: helix-turn-helix transcriptional regulator [Cyanobacteria bacterium P01_C01_bin.38]